MKEYHTKQREILMSLFQANREAKYTADEVFASLGEGAISRSAVYRNLDKMAEEGRIVREISDSGDRSVFSLNCAAKCEGHLHLKCLKCGRTIHLGHEVSEEILDSVKTANGFSVDGATVLYGVCDDCNGTDMKQKK